MIIAIGYRVRSNIGTNFRKWATNTLNEYMTKGFALNDNIAETTIENINSYFNNDEPLKNELCYYCGNMDRCRKERKAKCF